ncbi:hypothetical protein Psal006b_01599 [Piscirickettsia salmonis]|uniref:Transposase n=1 Tax=Piscirickettsia salmonis TaxID=1238 RepID=A0A1L6TBS4_PISSA|nr:IS3 family transposase [Piscirickettsia salmonis]AKP73956.1 hypothetical protein PSLF89_2220 [Piscirickettsia salmonis LF-89 = ATCC VR-1361]ALB22791.1 transposase [Piscirickettsia salmonis]ALY02780.1 hypothetical protein AWE47_07885 [Piscirickettsia salmonis]AMA42328.1 hypothetical protein AWJ11_08070 [Piscirickettsia salmonis]AOS34802.1 hypothetical protein AVM72_05230 [Piscirickettsia salmonis]
MNMNSLLSVALQMTEGELKAGVTEYIEFYNNKRFHQTLDYKKPMDVYCNLQPQLLLEAA